MYRTRGWRFTFPWKTAVKELSPPFWIPCPIFMDILTFYALLSCWLRFIPHPPFLWVLSGRLRILASMFWTCNNYLLKSFPWVFKKKHLKISKTELLIIFGVASDPNLSHLNKPLALYCHFEESSLTFYLLSGLTSNSSPIPSGATTDYIWSSPISTATSIVTPISTDKGRSFPTGLPASSLVLLQLIHHTAFRVII